MTLLGDAGWRGQKEKKGPRRSLISLVIFPEAGPTWNKLMCSMPALVRSLKMPSHCGFINPSYADLLRSAVLFQGISTRSNCAQQGKDRETHLSLPK